MPTDLERGELLAEKVRPNPRTLYSFAEPGYIVEAAPQHTTLLRKFFYRIFFSFSRLSLMILLFSSVFIIFGGLKHI